MLGVMGQMAPLTKMPQVRFRTILDNMIQVGRGQYHDRISNRMRSTMLRPAIRIGRRPFAAISRAYPYSGDYRFPVCRVTRFIFRSNRHLSTPRYLIQYSGIASPRISGNSTSTYHSNRRNKYRARSARSSRARSSQYSPVPLHVSQGPPFGTLWFSSCPQTGQPSLPISPLNSVWMMVAT